MVQVIRTEDPRGRISEMLGMSLGQGLGKGITTHFANEELNDIINDSSLKDASISAKMGKLQSALSKYGDIGKEVFQNRLQIEQQKMQEDQQAKQNSYNTIVGKILNKQPVSERERQSLPPEINMALSKHEQALELQNLKNQGRAAPGGITAQPVPQEVNQRIEEVLEKSRGLGADQLKLEFDKAGVPPVFSNSFIQSRREETKPTFEPESEKLEAKRVSELSTQIEKDYLTAKNENIRLNRMTELSEKGDVSTPLLIKGLDAIGLPIGILSNPDTEEYRKLETDFIRDARDVFPGGRITNYEIQSYLKTIPTLLNSKEGREAIIRNRKLFNEAKEIRYDEYKNIIKENGGKKPQNLGILLEERTADKISRIEDQFKQGIEKEVEKFQQPIPMIDPNGRPVNIPPNQIERAMKAGAKFR